MKLSAYRKGCLGKRGRKFLSSFLDLVMKFILVMVFFAISDAILRHVPAFVERQEEASAAQESLYRMVEDSHLSKREEGRLLSSEEIAEESVRKLTLESLLRFRDPAEISDRVYEDVEPMTASDDPLYFYYVDFKSRESESFLTPGGADVYQKELLETGFFEEREDGWLGLTEAAATEVDAYLVHGYLHSEETYNDIFNTYQNAILIAQKDLIGNYQPYLYEIGLFETARDEILKMRGGILLLSFLLSSLVLDLLLPLLLKEGRTLSMRILHLAQVGVDGRRFGIVHAIPFFLLSLLSSAFLPFLASLVLFGAEGVSLMSVNLLGFLNVFVLMLVALAYLLLSSLFDLWTRKGIHQTLTQFLSMTVVRDTSEWVEDDEDGKTEG